MILIGWTALHFAIANNHSEIVNTLLRAGAKTNIRNADNKSARDLAIEFDYPNYISLMKEETDEDL